MSKSKRPIKLSDDEIRAVYAQGEDAVVSLVRQLLSRLDEVESRLETLEGRSKKTSQNSHKPPSGDGLGNEQKVYARRVINRQGANRVTLAGLWSGVRR